MTGPPADRRPAWRVLISCYAACAAGACLIASDWFGWQPMVCAALTGLAGFGLVAIAAHADHQRDREKYPE